MRTRTHGSFLAALSLAATLLLASPALAHGDLVDLLPPGGDYAAGFDGAKPKASVRDGYLYGHGYETHRVVKGGRLRIDRVKVYTRVEHPELHRLVKLPEPWTVRQTLLLTPSLRLVRSTTRLEFHKSIDHVLEDYVFSEEHERYFEFDYATVTAVAGGRKLRHVRKLGDAVVEDETYDYPRDAVPIEIVGVALSAALHHGVYAFEYDILLPGGDTHGVKVDVKPTRDMTSPGEPYRLPKRFAPQLKPGEDVLLMDMRLSSPIKKLVFPYHFYIAYLKRSPENVIAFWGGKPGQHTYAFRTDDWRAPTPAPTPVTAQAE